MRLRARIVVGEVKWGGRVVLMEQGKIEDE
jgi:hypothetical protein